MTGRVLLALLALLGPWLAPSAGHAQIATRRAAPPDAIFTGHFITFDSQ